MKEIYEEYFQVTEENTVREKVMCSRAVVSLITVLLILGIMGMTAYAYFGLYVTSPATKVEAAYFHTNMTVMLGDQTVASGDADVHTVSLEAGKTYTITLKPSGTAQTGFAILKFEGNGTVYHTQQLGADKEADGGKTPQIQFVVASEKSVTLEIKASWGTSAYYGKVDKSAEKYVFDGESLIFGVLPTGGGADDQTDQNAEAETKPGDQTQSTVPADQAQTTEPTVPADQTQTEETTAPADPSQTDTPDQE